MKGRYRLFFRRHFSRRVVIIAICLFFVLWLPVFRYFLSQASVRVRQIADIPNMSILPAKNVLLAEKTRLVFSSLRQKMKNLTVPELVDKNAHGDRICELLLAGLPACRTDAEGASPQECITKFGTTALAPSLSKRCTSTAFWKAQPSLGQESGDETDFRDPTLKAHEKTTPKYVPPSERTYAIFGQSYWDPSLQMWMHPLGYAFPRTLMVNSVPRLKLFDFCPLLPLGGGKTRPFSHNDEYLVSQLYHRSYFAWSQFRNGLDAMRHLEILARGAVPYMPDILQCGVGCLTGYPKKLMREALKLPGALDPQHVHLSDKGQMIVPGKIDWEKFDEQKYYSLAETLLDFTHKHLTCAALVAYMLKAMGHEEPTSVLLIIPPFFDYMAAIVECGFDELGIPYATNMIETLEADDGVPRGWWPGTQKDEASNVATEEKRAATFFEHKLEGMYGLGFNWARRINAPPNGRIVRSQLSEKVKANKFDLVLYVYVQDDLPLLEEVAAHLPPSRIGFVEASDLPRMAWPFYWYCIGPCRWLSWIVGSFWQPPMKARPLLRQGASYFVRELHHFSPPAEAEQLNN